MIRFNAAGPQALLDRKAPGAKRRLDDAQLAELETIVAAGPDPACDGVVRWRCRDLQTVIAERFGVHYKERAVAYLLRKLGFSRISRPPAASQTGWPSDRDVRKKLPPHPEITHRRCGEEKAHRAVVPG